MGSDHSFRAEPDDLVGAVPQLGEDRVGVLAESGRAVAEAARGLRQIDGGRRQRRRAGEPGVLAVVKEPGRPDMRVLQRLLAGDARGSILTPL